MKKRILSLATAAALACGTIIAPMTISAATTTLLNETFGSSTVSEGIEYTVNNDVTYKGEAITMKNSFAVDGGELVLKVYGSGSYGEDHAFRTATTVGSTDNKLEIAKLSPVTLKIPFGPVASGSVVDISLDFDQPSANGNSLNGGMFWHDFASIYDADGNAVVVCKRDKDSDNKYFLTEQTSDALKVFNDVGRCDSLKWIGKQEAYKGNAIDLNNLSTDTELVIGAGTWNLGTDNTMTFKIDTATKQVDITYIGGGRTFNSDNTTYAANGDLTKGGYILFDGYLNTWTTTSQSKGDEDVEIDFDNISITYTLDNATLPVNQTMDTAGYESKLETNANADRYSIIDEPDGNGNKVLAVKTQAYSKGSSSEQTAMRGAVWFPYKGLGSNDNLKISYRFKDPQKNHNLYWEHFGSIVNTTDTAWSTHGINESDVLRCGRYDYETGFIQESYEWTNYLSYVGMTAANSCNGALARDGATQSRVSYDVASISDWIKVDIVIERATGKATITYTNDDTNTVLKTGDIYLIKDLASSGALYFKGGPSVNQKSGEQTIYIDDVQISTWKPLSVESTNLSNTYNAASPITLTFSDAVSDGALIKQAISIKETVSGTEVAPDRISVTLDSTKKIATVTVADGLRYGNVGYTLTLTGGIIKSDSNIALTADYTITFTTSLSADVYVASATDLASNSSTVTITNPTNTPKSVWALLALYGSNNELIGVDQYTNDNLGANTTTDPITLTAIPDEGKTVDKAHILIWNSNTGLIPYHIPVQVK